jgi:hypothetical protein
MVRDAVVDVVALGFRPAEPQLFAFGATAVEQ